MAILGGGNMQDIIAKNLMISGPTDKKGG